MNKLRDDKKHKLKFPTSNEKMKKKIWNEMLYRKNNAYYCDINQPSGELSINKEKVNSEEEYLKYKMGKYLLNNTKNTKKLSFKELVARYWYKVFLLFWAAFVFNFGIHIFLAKSDTIPSGITGIPTILQYLFPFLTSYFALIYFACNLPLFIIFWKKVKRSFLVLTLVFMLFLQVTNFIFTQHDVHVFLFEKISFIHNDTNDFTLVFRQKVDGDTVGKGIFYVIDNHEISSLNQAGYKYQIAPLQDVFKYLETGKYSVTTVAGTNVPIISQEFLSTVNPEDVTKLLKNPNEYGNYLLVHDFKTDALELLPVSKVKTIFDGNLAVAPFQSVVDFLKNNQPYEIKSIPGLYELVQGQGVSLLPQSALSALTLEQANQLIWYANGQTWPILLYGCMGAAFIGVGIALSWKAGGSTGGTDIIAYFFSTKYKKSVGGILASVAFCTACLFLIVYGVIKPNINGEVFGMRELSTFAYLIVTNIVVSILYPKYKKVKLTIISNEPEKVLAYFKLINYWHSYRIVRFKSGYTGKYSFKIETVALLLETKNIVSDLKLVDPNIWISTMSVSDVKGSFNTQYVEQ
ncbi:YitT family protein [Mycoplasma seminis]|uniref:YitT family protein n=1 Tax=Mycoplasma seminis TaxID=512749 RepID=A0ABY9HAX3_9MOLU|nr:YitT family protein [Mycoplasma seminis]WLP85596.1 YitT family protein [Mycoplasma seminis]